MDAKRLNQQIESLTQRIEELEIENESLQGQNEALEEKIDSLQQRNDSLEDENWSLDNECEKIIGGYDSQISSLQNYTQQLEQALNQWQSAYDELNKTKSKTEHQNSSLQMKMEKYESECKHFQEQRKKLEAEAESQRIQLRILNEKLHARQLMIEVPKDSKKFRDLESRFLQTTKGVYVVKIEKIVNKSLLELYNARKKTVEEECITPTKSLMNLMETQKNSAGEECIIPTNIERELWHGTTKDIVERICTNGFNRSYAGKNATRFGKGVYFATTAGYSVVFSQAGKSDYSYMLLSKVLTGKYCPGKEDDIDVPQGYHSTVDDSKNPSMYIVYRDASALPKFLFTFKSFPSAKSG